MIRENKKIIIIIIAIIAIIIAILVGISISKKDAIDVQVIEEKAVEFYVLRVNDKYGVIDKAGNVVIEPQYSDIQIPNPTIDLFLCTNETRR